MEKQQESSIQSSDIAELKKNNEAILAAVQELTKIVGERMKGMEEEWGKWRKAGKF